LIRFSCSLKQSKWSDVMNRNRYPNHLAALLTRPLVALYRQHACSNPPLPPVGRYSANPHWRVFARKVFGLVSIAANSGAKIRFVALNSGVPRLARERRIAVLASHHDIFSPFRIFVASHILRFKPRRIKQCWFPNLIHSLCVFNAKAFLRTKPFSGHFAWGDKHYGAAGLAGFLLAHVFSHEVILPRFFGSGTTGQVSQALGRNFIGCELNPEYKPLQDERTAQPSLLLEAA